MAVSSSVRPPGCCGRPLISQGLLPQARAYAERLVTGLLPIAERGESILFCEPSCLSAVKEDAPSLLRGDLQRKARGAYGVDFFLTESAFAGQFTTQAHVDIATAARVPIVVFHA